MKKIILLCTLFFSFITAAAEHNSHSNEADEAKVVVTQVLDGAVVYGDKWQDNIESINIEQAIAEAAQLTAQEMVFTGTIGKVCQKQGCWMMLETNGVVARVDFNNHAFFIPKDSQGKAEVLGTLHEKALSDEKRQHLEAEGAGKLESKIFEITATSVKIQS